MTLPKEAKARKDVPLYSGLVRYFPNALAAVAELSRVGNDQHNPGQPLHWDRTKSTDEHDALCRHLFEAGTVDSDGVLHSTKVAWRALAALEKELEAANPLETLEAAVTIPDSRACMRDSDGVLHLSSCHRVGGAARCNCSREYALWPAFGEVLGLK